MAECSRSYFFIKLGTLVPSSPDVMRLEDFGSMRGRRVKMGQEGPSRFATLAWIGSGSKVHKTYSISLGGAAAGGVLTPGPTGLSPL